MILNESNQQRYKIIVISIEALDMIITDLLECILIILSLFFVVSNYIVRDLKVGQRSKLLGYQYQSALLIPSVYLTFKVSKISLEKAEILISPGRFSGFGFVKFLQTIYLI